MDYLGNLKNGIIAGLAGGMVFGVLMGMMGMLPMIGGMVGMPSALAGFLIHMMMSGAIGAGFGLFVAPLLSGKAWIAAGTAYGVLWWVMGPLTLMPWLMGMGFAANLNAAGMTTAMDSLVGHLLFGVVLGYAYFRLHEAGRYRTNARVRRPA